DEVLDGDSATLGVQRREAVEVDDLELGAERVLEPSELGQPHVQRHLPTLEAGRHLVTGLGALGAATSGLAASATLTTTHPDLGALRPGCGTQVVNLERTRGGVCLALRGLGHGYSTSSTSTRWATVVIMPRISGRSS